MAIGLWRSKPAALRRVTLVSVVPGSPVVARLALTYGAGARPYSVILDVHGVQGGGGSATVTGDREQVALPVAGALEESPRVTATLAYRVLGRLYERVQEF